MSRTIYIELREGIDKIYHWSSGFAVKRSGRIYMSPFPLECVDPSRVMAFRAHSSWDRFKFDTYWG